MKVELIVCSFLPVERLNKDDLLDVLVNNYKGKYTDFNAPQANPNQARGGLQLLLAVKDFLAEGMALNAFDAKVDILHNPQKETLDITAADLAASFDALAEFFSFAKKSVGRLSVLGITTDSLSDEGVKKAIESVSKVSDNAIEMNFRDVLRKRELNIVRSFQAAQGQTAAEGQQAPKNLVVSVEVNNIPRNPEDRSLAEVREEVVEEFVSSFRAVEDIFGNL